MHIHLNKAASISGFAAENIMTGNIVKVLVRASIISDEQEFYIYTDQITQIFLSNHYVLTDAIYQFLILIHKDLSADIYINDFATVMEMSPNKTIQKGQLVMDNDIIDIRRLEFPEIEILETDRVIYCFKVGWKFGLFFDFNNDGLLDLDKMYLDLGKLTKRLKYEHLYKLFESPELLEEMQKDGWFPFVEIIHYEFKVLIEAYKDKFDFDNRIGVIVDRFDKDRIENITNRWWDNKIFFEKQSIIKAGIKSFLQADDDGYINCIKNLITEVEGILRMSFYKDTNKGKGVVIKVLLEHLVEKCIAKSGYEDSLLFPRHFYNYLNDVIFSGFDVETGKLELSRNSSSHGVAQPGDYSKIRALQMILILDQLYFYL